MRYILDGYNVIKRVPRFRQVLRDGSLEDARNRLETDCMAFCHRREIELIIVYDNKEFSSSHSERRSGISIEFAHPGITADEYIYKKIVRASNRKSIVVVTADRELSENVKAEGARTVSPGEFCKLMGKSVLNSQIELPSEKPSEVDLEYWKEVFKGRKDE